MSTVYYKAVRPDGTDFRTGTVRYDVGATVTHPNPHRLDASGYLSVSTSPTGCTGMEWPCRLLVVEPVEPWTPDRAGLPNKRACHSLRVVREVPAHEALGPQGEHVAALIDRAASLSGDDLQRLAAARDAAWAAARDAAWAAAWDAARAAAWDAAWAAARDAAWAAAWAAARGLVVRDLIGTHGFTQAHYDTLTGLWRKTIGPVHPEDGEVP